MTSLRRAAAYIVDCDGVLFDTNALKTDAFAEVLSAYPAGAVEAFLDYHRAHGGISRYHKLAHFFDVIHPVDDAPSATAEAIARFGEAVSEGYRATAPLTAAVDFLRAVDGARTAWVVSGSDQDELREAFAWHGLDREVAGIYGSPTSKLDHVRTLVERHSLDPARTVFIGDGRADYETARALGMPFVFLRQHSEWPDADAHLAGDPTVFIAGTWADIHARLADPDTPLA